MKKTLSAVLLHALLLPIVNAQSKSFDQDVQLKTCNISIEANPFIASTFIEMEFYNSRDVEVEGFQNFKLNKGQVVSAFQLDLNGKYRDGSIEERWKANNAYSRIVGKRIDPAILSLGYDDVYSLRIYPIPPHSSRKVTLTIDQLMLEDSMKLNYVLPLNFLSITENFSLKINVSNVGTIPVCNKGFLQNSSFDLKENTMVSNLQLKNVKLDQPVSFYIPLKTSMPLICISKEEGVSKFLMRFTPQVPKYYPVKPVSISVFWDVSASADARDIDREINFLEEYVIQNRINTITLTLFNQKIQDKQVLNIDTRNFNYLKKYLANYTYAGATCFGNLDFGNTKADAILLFSDGYNSIGKDMPSASTVPVHCITSTKTFNQSQLVLISSESGGRLINLYDTEIKNAVKKIDQAENFLLKYSSALQSVVLNEKFPMKLAKNILLSGTFKNKDYLQLIFGNSGAVNQIENISLQETDQCGKDIYKKVKMLKSYDSLLNSDQWQNMVYFGLKEKVVTKQTSFLVLERVEDYIKYNIAPPKELEEQCAEMNYVYKSEYKIRALKTFSEQDALQETVKSYNRYIKWWSAKEDPIDLYKPLPLAETERGAIASSNNMAKTPVDPGMNEGRSNSIKEVIVTSAFQTKRTARSQSSNVQVINSEQLNTVRSYDVNNALAGKVAGAQVRSQSSIALGRETSIRLRGENGLGIGNGPVYVVDGAIMSSANDINIDDIDNITVLQGPAASALFGPDGINGAIVITNKKARRNYGYYTRWSEYKLKDMEDVDYMGEITGFETRDLWNRYTEIEKEYKEKAAFYFDMADYFFERKLKSEAVEILYNGIEASRGSKQGLKVAAYMFESWKNFREAIKIYLDILDKFPHDMITKRDLALAYFQNGNYQEAVNTYYQVISSTDRKYYDDNQVNMIALNEMNAVISLHKNKLDLSAINPNLIKTLPVDLRMTIETNYGPANSVRIKEPTGKEVADTNPGDENSGYFSNRNIYNYYYHDAPEEYSLKNAVTGSYRVKLNCYNYYNGGAAKAPVYLRLVVFKNFQKENQSMEVQYIVLDNQYGSVEVAEVKF